MLAMLEGVLAMLQGALAMLAWRGCMQCWKTEKRWRETDRERDIDKWRLKESQKERKRQIK